VRLLPAFVVAVLGACTPLPKAELTAYTTSYAATHEVTNGILDIVAPYERVVMRTAAGDTMATLPAPRPPGPAPASIRRATRSSALPPPDPSLFADPGAVKPSRPLPPPDPSLFADPGAVKPSRPLPPPDPSLFADPGAVKPSQPVVSTVPVAPTAAPATDGDECSGVAGADPFCFRLAAAWADIGDPPLVAAYRNLSDVILRFNNLLIAYANGVDGRFLQQDLSDLSQAAAALTQFAPIAAVGGASGFTASFNSAIAALAPIAGAAGGIADRAQLRSFLLNNYDAVDQAMAMMAANSVELYANVAIGTNLYRRALPPGAGQSLVKRRQDIRRLLANWIVLLEDNRRLLRALRAALLTPDGVETRLNNLGPPISASVDADIIKKQMTTLGSPTLAP
jgi:hypothetical protein